MWSKNSLVPKGRFIAAGVGFRGAPEHRRLSIFEERRHTMNEAIIIAQLIVSFIVWLLNGGPAWL